MNGTIFRSTGKWLLSVLLALVPMGALAAPQTGWWWNPSEPGRGFAIEISGGKMYMGGFLYDASGNPTWVMSNGTMMSPTSYSGSLATLSGGQTLNGAYQPPTMMTTLGNVSINFTSDTQATLTWPGGSMMIQRYDIVPGGHMMTGLAGTPEAGWWWDPDQPGRGFAMEIQGNAILMGAFMYDSNGNPVWYTSGPVSMADMMDAFGSMMEFGNGQTMMGMYRSPTMMGNAGAFAMQFTSSTTGLMTLPGGSQVKMMRFRF